MALTLKTLYQHDQVRPVISVGVDCYAILSRRIRYGVSTASGG